MSDRMDKRCEDGMCWAEPLGDACDHWRLRVLALENHGLELAAQLGEAEHQLAGAVDALREARRSLEAAASWLVDTERHERMLAARRRVDDALERLRGR